MVTEITAFTADDGSIHKSKLAALEHDTLEKLKKLECFNHASASEVVRRCMDVHTLLTPLVEEALSVANHIAAEQELANLQRSDI